MTKTAFITGISGQDGSYLAEFLLGKGYHVVGMVRRSPQDVFPRIEHLRDQITLVQADLTDQAGLIRVLAATQPHEVYNLGAQSFVAASWEQPVLTAETTGVGVARLLEAIRLVCPHARFYQASSSEMFGNAATTPQDENTPFHPRSPYGVAKAFGHHLTVNYRESFGLFACSGILFNHESPRRGREFVTRKISRQVARIRLGSEEQLRLGNLHARRDWGFAGDYVEAMWLMLQQESPRDFVVGTGVDHSVADFVEVAFAHAGLDWRRHVLIDETLKRPAEVDLLRADPTKACEELGWKPRVEFDALVRMMVDADTEEAKRAKGNA